MFTDPSGNQISLTETTVVSGAIGACLTVADTLIRTRGRASGWEIAGSAAGGFIAGAGGGLLGSFFLQTGFGGKLFVVGAGAAAGLFGVGDAVSEERHDLALFRGAITVGGVFVGSYAKIPAESVPDVYDSPYLIRVTPGVEGRPSPQWSIDTKGFAGVATQNGGVRNAARFWAEWLRLRPETISAANRAIIEALQENPRGISPRVDGTWISAFKEHTIYLNEALVHHHVDQGRFAIPVPQSTHVGSGGAFHGQPNKP